MMLCLFLSVLILTSKIEISIAENGEIVRNGNNLNAIVTNGTVSVPIHLEVNKFTEYIIQYQPDNTFLATVPLRVTVISKNATSDTPVMVVVRQKKEVISWELPIHVDDSNGGATFQRIARTLCYDSWNASRTRRSYTRMLPSLMLDDPPIVSVATASETNVSVEIQVQPEEEFRVRPDQEYTVVVTPSEPKYFYYDFPDNMTKTDNTETVVLVVTSEDNVCMTVSIQNASCPVFDLNHDVKFEGLWETMNRKGGITITKSKFPYGFFVVFVPKGDDVECEGDDMIDAQNRTKTVTYVIKPSISYVDYVNAIMATVACILLFYIVFGVGFFVCSSKVYIPRTMEYMGDAMMATPTTPMSEHEMLDNISRDETEYDTIAEVYCDREAILTKSEVFLSDLARKDFRILKRKSYSYLWHILTVALFYGLPVAQLVITYQKVLNDTGNQDLCYYNFLCAHPLGFFSDFNHLFSNVGYVLFGLLFLVIVYRRECWHKDNQFDQHYGIPQHYGMFYAMGVGLTMEGILSGSYHICPNHTNFQFDSSFMYIMAVISMVKIYQTRHPDINATAYSTFGVLAAAIFLGMWGILASSLYFWIGFTVVHIFVGFYLTAQIYYMGCWRAGFRNYWASLRNICQTPMDSLRPKYTAMFVLLVIGNLCNWALAVYGILYHQKDFAMHLLGIFMINNVLYFIFYIVMKILHKEHINMIALSFLIISLTCACVAMYCFLNKSISWALTPAGSRRFNQECKLMRFYDYHDIWHFLSAIGMFFMFMVMLLLDDDISHVHRTKIHVF